MSDTQRSSSDISAPIIGQQIHCPFVVTKIVEKKASNGQLFRNVELTNETGRILTRVWQRKFPEWEGIAPGSPVMVRGRIEQGYPEDTLELVVQEVQLLEAPHPVQKYMNPIYPGDVRELEAEFERLRNQIRHPGYRLFFDRFFETACPKEKFFTAPAASSNHHAYIHGLLEHSLEVTRTALHFADQPALRGLVHRDLVLVGAMIHDAGKIHEYVWEGVPIGRHPDALLYGHLTTGPLMVQETYLRHAEELSRVGFTAQDVKYLIHLIISHHGKLEWGSPTPPAMIAAEILHQADMMSSKVRAMAEIARNNTPDEYGHIPGPSYGEHKNGIIADPLYYYDFAPSTQEQALNECDELVLNDNEPSQTLADRIPGLFDNVALQASSVPQPKTAVRRR